MAGIHFNVGNFVENKAEINPHSKDEIQDTDDTENKDDSGHCDTDPSTAVSPLSVESHHSPTSTQDGLLPNPIHHEIVEKLSRDSPSCRAEIEQQQILAFQTAATKYKLPSSFPNPMEFFQRDPMMQLNNSNIQNLDLLNRVAMLHEQQAQIPDQANRNSSPATKRSVSQLDCECKADEENHNTVQFPQGSGQWSYEEQFKQLYEMGNEADRKQFLDELFAFMQKRGTPVNRIPIMAKETLDIYRLFKLVVSKGGLVEVINKKLWREITKGLNLPSSITSAAFTLRTQYMKYIYPYECEKYRFSTLADLHTAIEGNKRDGRRPGLEYSLPPAGHMFNPHMGNALHFNTALLSNNPMINMLGSQFAQNFLHGMGSHPTPLRVSGIHGLPSGAVETSGPLPVALGSLGGSHGSAFRPTGQPVEDPNLQDREVKRLRVNGVASHSSRENHLPVGPSSGASGEHNAASSSTSVEHGAVSSSAPVEHGAVSSSAPVKHDATSSSTLEDVPASVGVSAECGTALSSAQVDYTLAERVELRSEAPSTEDQVSASGEVETSRISMGNLHLNLSTHSDDEDDGGKSMGVAMDLNGVVYQGTLFAQPKSCS